VFGAHWTIISEEGHVKIKTHVEKNGKDHEITIHPRFKLINLANFVTHILKPDEIEERHGHGGMEAGLEHLKQLIKIGHYPKKEWTNKFESFTEKNKEATSLLQKIVDCTLGSSGCNEDVHHGHSNNQQIEKGNDQAADQHHEPDINHSVGRKREMDEDDIKQGKDELVQDQLRQVIEDDTEHHNDENQGSEAGLTVLTLATRLIQNCEHAQALAQLLHVDDHGLECTIKSLDKYEENWEKAHVPVDDSPEAINTATEAAKEIIEGLRKSGISTEKGLEVLENSRTVLVEVDMENDDNLEPAILAMPAPSALLPPWPLPSGQLRRRHPWCPLSYMRQGSRIMTSRRCQLAQGFL